MEGLIEGRIVHYVLPEGPNQGEHRPAVVVRAWGRYPHASPEASGMVNLQVFFDGTNDGHGLNTQPWRTSVHYSEEQLPGTWHWIERA